MVFDPVAEEQRKRFFRQNYGAHLPGYTGHCPTLKFRVGKRFGASTEEIMKELLEKKILKTGPYRPNSSRDVHGNGSIPCGKDDIRRDWKTDAQLFKSPPYILGYTGYIPGFNSCYGLSFIKAVEEGAREWRENQNKLRARERRDAMKAQAERCDPRNLLSRARADNVAIEIDHDHDRNRTTFHYEISPERPPIVGYTGHIPGAKGEVALSKRYGQAARKGLELIRKEREERLSKLRTAATVQKALNDANVYETEHTRT
ncbi:protein FAM166B-like [Hylaeus anthracinus]|uniref:protein FAM166B-like n=1 Tax=Hylaeus anthracinus TaxID=313031 RepID=UPI0023B9F351|nr:protein FAM166B-like [Hylaeus anthracinus]XP_053996456.1 protein FAM166B-like [Hylaeus anthracinus]XP_053996457.1 protein FAM166B-like [Hylaeus anthracinus]XP_053996458.1 protein FAM166B-like [Hylaeus anthracinus]